jgi:hypothetical protein
VSCPVAFLCGPDESGGQAVAVPAYMRVGLKADVSQTNCLPYAACLIMQMASILFGKDRRLVLILYYYGKRVHMSVETNIAILFDRIVRER